MLDTYDTKPDAAELEAARVGIIAFRKQRQSLTKIDLAVEFVRERGVATSAELHVLLGEADDVAPSTYLAPATRDGRLVKDGKNWTLGPNAPKAPPTLDWAQQKPEALHVPKFSQQQADVTRATSSRYRFGMWSDGQIEIQRNGVQLACLPRDVVEELVMFYASVRSVA